MAEPVYLTEEGIAKLKDELQELTGPRRTDLAKRLRSAVQMGDLSENADYHKAKEDQAFLEGRIQEIEYMLRNSVIIEKNAPAGTVGIGSHVTIQEAGLPEETYHVVGPKEADPRNGRISYESPIGRALVDHRVGETVEVETPAGRLKLKITKIE